jgi:hypothetical protein
MIFIGRFFDDKIEYKILKEADKKNHTFNLLSPEDLMLNYKMRARGLKVNKDEWSEKL